MKFLIFIKVIYHQKIFFIQSRNQLSNFNLVFSYLVQLFSPSLCSPSYFVKQINTSNKIELK